MKLYPNLFDPTIVLASFGLYEFALTPVYLSIMLGMLEEALLYHDFSICTLCNRHIYGAAYSATQPRMKHDVVNLTTFVIHPELYVAIICITV